MDRSQGATGEFKGSRGRSIMFAGQATKRRPISALLALLLVMTLVPSGAFALREGETSITPVDSNSNGKPDGWEVDWDGDGVIDETWTDTNEDGVVDSVEVENTGGDSSRSPRGRPGMRVGNWPLAGGGDLIAVDWDGDGRYDESWWDNDGDGTVDDTDTYKTESKVLDNTKATRFRGVFVGVRNGLNHPEKDADDLTEALGEYPASWAPGDMNTLKGGAATPAAIQGAINAAKASSKPGDEFVFYFSGHGGGYDKDTGLAGGRLDTDGDETAIRIPEREFGRFDGSTIATPAPGFITVRPLDLDGNGTTDTRIVKDEHGGVSVERPNPTPPPPWMTAGTDTDGDDDVDGADGGVDMNADGDKDDTVGIDDTILVAGKAKVTDDQLAQWLSGFPQSVTIVVILDSCYSGSFIPDLKNGVKDSTGMPLRPGHLEVVAAAPADDGAWEMPISNGVLTQGILNSLMRLPGSITGGHTTSLADCVGDTDDRTTTRELFRWAGPAAVTYSNYDNDGDGLRNEDGALHVLDTGDDQTVLPDDLPSPYTGSDIAHQDIDDDGDGLINEDPPPTVASFFDVYYDPSYGKSPVPTFITAFSGDDPLSATGMQPGFGVYSEGPLAPGTAMAPGPTFQMDIREVPVNYEPGLAPGLAYVSRVYDLSLAEITQSHDLEETTDTAEPSMVAELIEGPTPFGNLYATIAPVAGSNPGMPYRFDSMGGEWVPVVPVEPPDPDTGVVTIRVDHLSKYALIGPLPGRPADTTAPDAPWQLEAHVTGDDATLTWRNPTDDDFSASVLLRSDTGFATVPTGGGDQVIRDNTQHPFFLDADLDGGIYYYTLFARDHALNYSEPAMVYAKIDDPYSTQIAGTDRYKTAVQASRQAFPAAGSLPDDSEGHKSVVVATGQNWPDALGGSALAGAVGGPILLVRKDSLPADVATEITRLGADRVLLLGETPAVSAVVATALDRVSGVEIVERIGGTDRYATAEKIAARAVGLVSDYDGTALIVTGANFPDALAGSPLAASKVWPIYLCSASGLTSSTKTRIAADGVTDALILGGTPAVSASVATYLDGALTGDVERLSGADRYATAAAVASYAVDDAGMRWDGVALSTGENFPDALAGGVMQGFDGSVILLTRSTTLSAATRLALQNNAYRIAEVRFLGGTAAMSTAVRTQAMEAVQ